MHKELKTKMGEHLKATQIISQSNSYENMENSRNFTINEITTWLEDQQEDYNSETIYMEKKKTKRRQYNIQNTTSANANKDKKLNCR